MTTTERIPFNTENEGDAADAIAEQLRLRGHDAHAEFIGSGTSIFVALSPTRQALMCGWGVLEDWGVEFDVLRGDMWDRDHGADLIPGTTSHEIPVLADAIDAYLRGLDGYTPSSTEVRPLSERREYNDSFGQMREMAGEISGMCNTTDNRMENNPRLLLMDNPDVKAKIDAAFDALAVAHRLVMAATEAADALY